MIQGHFAFLCSKTYWQIHSNIEMTNNQIFNLHNKRIFSKSFETYTTKDIFGANIYIKWLRAEVSSKIYGVAFDVVAVKQCLSPGNRLIANFGTTKTKMILRPSVFSLDKAVNQIDATKCKREHPI